MDARAVTRCDSGPHCFACTLTHTSHPPIPAILGPPTWPLACRHVTQHMRASHKASRTCLAIFGLLGLLIGVLLPNPNPSRQCPRAICMYPRVAGLSRRELGPHAVFVAPAYGVSDTTHQTTHTDCRRVHPGGGSLLSLIR